MSANANGNCGWEECIWEASRGGKYGLGEDHFVQTF